MSFGHFRFQQKQIQWHFYIIIKKAKFLAHTLSLHLYLHSPMTLSLSLSPLVLKPTATPPISLSLLDKNVFSLLDKVVRSLSPSWLSSTMVWFCFVFFFFGTKLIRFGGGKSKLWL